MLELAAAAGRALRQVEAGGQPRDEDLLAAVALLGSAAAHGCWRAEHGARLRTKFPSTNKTSSGRVCAPVLLTTTIPLNRCVQYSFAPKRHSNTQDDVRETS